MRETHVGTELKAVAKDVLYLGVRYVQAGRAWLSDRREDMANHNEESGRGQSTYGTSGNFQERQQSSGPQQPWRESSGHDYQNQGRGQFQHSQQHGAEHFGSQGMGHRGLSGQGMSGQGMSGQGFGSGDRSQGWENEHTSGQSYGQGGQYGNQYGQSSQYGHDSQSLGSQGYGQGLSGFQGQGGQQGLHGQGSQYGQGYGQSRGLQEHQDFGRGGGFSSVGGFGSTQGSQMGYRSSLQGQDISGRRNFRGMGPKNYTRSDERIRDDVCERLTHDDDLDASEIEIRTEQGKVIMEGSVEERWMKHRAEDIAESCSGVREVENKIRVQSSQTRGSSETPGKSGDEKGNTQGRMGTAGKH